MTLRVHSDIASLSPYVPGKPIEELQRELGLSRVIKLASNENPLGPSPKALAVLSEGLTTLHRYPDGGAIRLREALADRWKVTPDHVILGNGSDEILGFLARAFLAPGDEAVMADHTFVIYKMEVTAAHGKPIIVPLTQWRHNLPAMVDATPEEFVIARDAIAVIVNPENPVSRLTLQQISAIYSGKVNNWQELGGEDRPIVRLSRETNSGTHVYFLENVIRLGKKDDKTLFSMDTLLLPSSEGIIAELRQNPNAIGYDGLGYVPKDLKMIAIAKEAGAPYVLPSIATVKDKSYPIARELYMYTNGEPTGVVKEYLDWILSPEAQEIVAKLGFVPVD